ncbi:hypothetical protein [Cronobacter sakazakii]|uniref:hypothetical protein n=1 Tax=Cronobacter sakazakii TaxID=28141 RepID=UPI002DB89776|nr:hypothetical protein [Cronobacter sakazakii]MEB8574911.1 hypothetical protein [Cronobacter sakazakii]
MSELNELIASEIADFFAGFGGPGEPDIQSGEAQRLLTERVLSVLALRERAEPGNAEFGDAYQGAREDLQIWKRRALEAEGTARRLAEINDYLVLQAQGECHFGEPVVREPGALLHCAEQLQSGGTALYTAPPAPVVPEWTNQQCLEFLAVAFRHAEIKGDFELDDLRLGVKMANAMTTGKEG